jgi:hypothetical protein
VLFWKAEKAVSFRLKFTEILKPLPVQWVNGAPVIGYASLLEDCTVRPTFSRDIVSGDLAAVFR